MQAITVIYGKQLVLTGGFMVKRTNEAGSVSNVVDLIFCWCSDNPLKGWFDDLSR